MPAHATQCPHCQALVVFQEALSEQPVVETSVAVGGRNVRKQLHLYRCPNAKCRGLIVELDVYMSIGPMMPHMSLSESLRLFPLKRGNRSRLLADAIPAPLRQLFNEAVLVELDSVRAACSLLRTCLEALLIGRGYRGELAVMIDAAREKERAWPESLLAKLHLVRFLGNFGAHWSLDDVGNVVDVDAGELEVMFATVEQALQVVFVGPAADAANIEQLNKKLEKAGKAVRLGPNGALTDAAGGPWPPPKQPRVAKPVDPKE